MRQLTKPLWWLYCIYAFLLFVIGMFCVLPFVAVYAMQDETTGGDRIYRVCRFWNSAWLKLIGIRPANIYESMPDPDKRYVFISNHISYLDIPMILQAIQRDGFRILGKAEMTRIPFFGFIYGRAVVLVDRTTARGRSRSVRELKSVLSIDRSVFIFPEGTFNETGQPLKKFYDGAFRLAIESQTPLQPILFVDTFDRLHYSSLFSLRPGVARAIFLPEVDVQGLTVDDLPLLKERVYAGMEEALIRHRVSWVQSV
jgi:1-acyl-sn-glycerol-3-phosphate acyltransferase